MEKKLTFEPLQIGALVKKLAKERGLGPTAFALKAGKKQAWAINQFNRTQINVEDLKLFSGILETDLFMFLLSKESKAEIELLKAVEAAMAPQIKMEETVSETELRLLRAQVEFLEKEVAYLKEINSILKR